MTFCLLFLNQNNVPCYIVWHSMIFINFLVGELETYKHVRVMHIFNFLFLFSNEYWFHDDFPMSRFKIKLSFKNKINVLKSFDYIFIYNFNLIQVKQTSFCETAMYIMHDCTCTICKLCDLYINHKLRRNNLTKNEKFFLIIVIIL